MSRPIRGAWIEMIRSVIDTPKEPSRPIRGAWIEIGMVAGIPQITGSRPIRGAWIEMIYHNNLYLGV